ncbi:MAG: M20/M25/M40 family metallo-hydrolase [Mesorhizobium sp.]
MIDPAFVSRLRQALDRDAALALLKRAVGTPSVTGNERVFAELLAGELEALGAVDLRLSDFAAGRPNVSALLEGAGGGPVLLLAGHTDTVHVKGWAERWAGTARQDPFGGAVVDGAIWGRGTGDLKAGIVATLSAARLLGELGAKPACDVLFAFIGDEESGEEGTGVSAGMKALTAEFEAGALPRPDFAVYVEPTQLQVFAAQMGFLIADITVTGRAAYFGLPELGVDALKAAHAVLSALWAHSATLAARPAHPLVGRPFLLVTGIAGGGSIAVPGECTISLILKLLPGDDLDAAAAALEAAVRGAAIAPEVELAFAYPAGRDHRLGGTPVETPAALPPVQLLQAAVRSVRPDRGEIAGAPYWSEAPFLSTRLGVPAVYCAPGDISNCHTLEEHVDLEEFYDGVVALAAFIAAFGRPSA